MTNFRSVFVRLCCLAALAPGHGRAEDQIVTDRPDFVESSLTVGKGRFQVETSVAGIHNRDGTLHEEILATPTLLRLGVADALELRLETDGYVRTRTEDIGAPPVQTSYGIADSALGLKWHMQDGEGGRPSVAGLLHADVRSGSESLRGHGIRPSLRASFEWELPSHSSLGVMPGVIYDSRDDGHRYAAGILGATLGHNWTERLHTFVEVAGRQLARPADGGNIITYGLGAAYLIVPTVQVDTGMFIGANHHTPDVSWTVGLSAKF
jgi:outer membrane putative beta-barrel porin/alpha-amylase